MRADHFLPAHEEFEVYNTYGHEHSSAQLLLRYGFFSETSEYDRVHWEDAGQVAHALHLPLPEDALVAGLLYIDSEGQCSPLLLQLLALLADRHNTTQEQLLSQLATARLSTLCFHEVKIDQLLDRRDQEEKEGRRDRMLALGYLISQRQMLEACS